MNMSVTKGRRGGGDEDKYVCKMGNGMCLRVRMSFKVGSICQVKRAMGPLLVVVVER